MPEVLTAKTNILAEMRDETEPCDAFQTYPLASIFSIVSL
jgi:hypothetical protein